MSDDPPPKRSSLAGGWKLLVARGAPRAEVNKIKRSTIVEQWKKLIGEE